MTNARPLDIQKKNAEIRGLESKIESMGINLASTLHDYELVLNKLEYVEFLFTNIGP